MASQPKLAPYVIQALIQVIAKITKLGWFEVQKDEFVFREIIADVKKFLQVRRHYYIIRESLLGFISLETVRLVATNTLLIMIYYLSSGFYIVCY